MKKIKWILTFAFVILLPGRHMIAQGIQEPVGMTVEGFMKQTNIKNKLVFINFKANWCVVCKKQDPILQEVYALKKDSIAMIIINMEENPIIAEYFEVDGLPLHFIYFEGTRVWDRMGIISRTDLLEILHLYDRILIKKR